MPTALRLQPSPRPPSQTTHQHLANDARNYNPLHIQISAKQHHNYNNLITKRVYSL